MFELLCSCTSLFTREVAWAGSLGSGLHVWPVPTWEEPGGAFLRVWGQDQHPHEGHIPLPAGWPGREELRFPTDFSRTVTCRMWLAGPSPRGNLSTYGSHDHRLWYLVIPYYLLLLWVSYHLLHLSLHCLPPCKDGKYLPLHR